MAPIKESMGEVSMKIVQWPQGQQSETTITSLIKASLEEAKGTTAFANCYVCHRADCSLFLAGISMGDNGEELPYWQMNVPQRERTQICPPYLEKLNAKDLKIISTPDDEYRVLAWDDVKAIVAANRIDRFQRVPSDLRRYLAYNHQVKLEYGSVMNYVLQVKLGWSLPLQPEGEPFKNAKDLKIKWNDWPYGIDPKIVHLVVWTKFDLPDDPETGFLTEKTRTQIENYVDETFCKRLKKQNVIWFKNWGSLKSVHAVEHFHVMLYDPDEQFIKEITNGDIPYFKAHPK